MARPHGTIYFQFEFLVPVDELFYNHGFQSLEKPMIEKSQSHRDELFYNHGFQSVERQPQK